MTHLRPAVVSLLALVAAVCMRSWGGYLPWQLWMPTGLLVAAAALAHGRSAGSQLLTRAILWANLILAVVAAWVGNHHEVPIAAILRASTGAALLVLGRAGLDRAEGDFVPVAFRSTLVALLVMALADAQTLALFGSLFVADSFEAGTGWAALAIAGGLCLAVLGLYRLRVWGLLVEGVACLGLLGFAVLMQWRLPPALNLALGASAPPQLILPPPLLIALRT